MLSNANAYCNYSARMIDGVYNTITGMAGPPANMISMINYSEAPNTGAASGTPCLFGKLTPGHRRQPVQLYRFVYQQCDA